MELSGAKPSQCRGPEDQTGQKMLTPYVLCVHPIYGSQNFVQKSVSRCAPSTRLSLATQPSADACGLGLCINLPKPHTLLSTFKYFPFSFHYANISPIIPIERGAAKLSGAVRAAG